MYKTIPQICRSYIWYDCLKCMILEYSPCGWATFALYVAPTNGDPPPA